MSLTQELSDLLNRHSVENDSDTPDFLLARFMLGCLDVFSKTVIAREAWYGRCDPERIKEGPFRSTEAVES